MSARNARRARTPLSPRTRRLLAAAAAALVLPAIMGASYVGARMTTAGPDGAGIEAEIRRVGFDPVNPPNRLRGPGALYAYDGASIIKVCEADDDKVRGRLQRSPTLSLKRDVIENVSLSVSAQLVERLKAALGAGHTMSLRFTLTDVTIKEIPLDHLFDIQEELLNRKSCQAAVDHALAANLKVCQGYAALSATTSYALTVDRDFDIRAETPEARSARLALEEAAGTKLRAQSATELSGEDLYVGIRLVRRCIVPNTATEPSTIAATPPKSWANWWPAWS
jgi:hypothetical protein